MGYWVKGTLSGTADVDVVVEYETTVYTPDIGEVESLSTEDFEYGCHEGGGAPGVGRFTVTNVRVLDSDGRDGERTYDVRVTAEGQVCDVDWELEDVHEKLTCLEDRVSWELSSARSSLRDVIVEAARQEMADHTEYPENQHFQRATWVHANMRFEGKGEDGESVELADMSACGSPSSRA